MRHEREFIINCPVCDRWVATINYSGGRDLTPEWNNYECSVGHKFAVSNTKFDFRIHDIRHFVNNIEIDQRCIFLPTKEMPVNLSKRNRLPWR